MNQLGNNNILKDNKLEEHIERFKESNHINDLYKKKTDLDEYLYINITNGDFFVEENLIEKLENFYEHLICNKFKEKTTQPENNQISFNSFKEQYLEKIQDKDKKYKDEKFIKYLFNNHKK